MNTGIFKLDMKVRDLSGCEGTIKDLSKYPLVRVYFNRMDWRDLRAEQLTPAEPKKKTGNQHGEWSKGTQSDSGTFRNGVSIWNENNTHAPLSLGNTMEEAQANAAHIVKCVNNHTALVEALREGYIMALGSEGAHRLNNQAALCLMRNTLSNIECISEPEVNDKYEDIRITRKMNNAL